LLCVQYCREALAVLKDDDDAIVDYFRTALQSVMNRARNDDGEPNARQSPEAVLSALSAFMNTRSWDAATQYLRSEGPFLLGTDLSVALSILESKYRNNSLAELVRLTQGAPKVTLADADEFTAIRSNGIVKLRDRSRKMAR
jgi:hypothetical protein